MHQQTNKQKKKKTETNKQKIFTKFLIDSLMKEKEKKKAHAYFFLSIFFFYWSQNYQTGNGATGKLNVLILSAKKKWKKNMKKKKETWNVLSKYWKVLYFVGALFFFFLEHRCYANKIK